MGKLGWGQVRVTYAVVTSWNENHDSYLITLVLKRPAAASQKARGGDTLPFLLVTISKHFFASALSNRPEGKPLTTATPVNTHTHEFTHSFPNPRRTNRTYSEVSGESGCLGCNALSWNSSPP
jgi:hypothetical protein